MLKKISLFTILIFLSCSDNEIIQGELPDAIDPIDNTPTRTECVNGLAGEYPCEDYDLMSQIPNSEFFGAGTEGNDSWGWFDTTTNKEYVIMCTTRGTAFVDITNPLEPIIVGTLASATGNSNWRDIKVYNDFAFIVSEASNHGMQIFDLKRLRNVTNTPQTFDADSNYNAFGNAHNIVINEQSGFAYAVGTQTFAGGPHFVDITDPLTPLSAGGYAADSYSHDAQVVTYTGPDSRYTGKEILIGSNENEIVLVDVSDKANPVQISTITYANIGYTHQGWFTDNQRYFILGDELDERNFGGNSRSLIFDFSDLENPTFHFQYLGPTAAIDHNGYIKGNLFYQANYTAGVRIVDVSNIENQSMTEVGFFDTYPENNSTNFNGTWNVYPYLPSGNIIISDIERGLFVIRKSGT